MNSPQNLKVNGLPQMASVQELQRGYRKLLDLVKKTKEPLYLLRNNKPEVVVLDVDKFGEMNKMIRKYEEEDALKMIRAYKRAKKAGKLMSVKSLSEID